METFGASRAPPVPVDRDRFRAAPSSPSIPTARARSASPSPRPWKWRPRIRQSKYALGSVLNHVLLHQTVIGQEAIEQMEMAGDDPDVIIGCTGGGSNFAGLVIPVPRAASSAAGASARIVAVEPAACPSRSPRGRFAYDFGDTAHLTPLVKMHTLGITFIPPGIPRRRPALSRHGAAGLACQRARA